MENNIDLNGINNILYKNNELSNAVIEISNYCNFKCDHCYMPNCAKKNMDFETYKKIVDELFDIGCLSILLTGGEPILNFDFKKMYIYAKCKGFLVSVNTNGSLLNDEIINLFCEYPPHVVEISLYGYDNKSYSNFTHFEKAYELVYKNLLKLKKKKINVNLKTVLTRHNFRYFNDIIELSNKLKLPFRYDYIVFPKVDNISVFNEERLTEQDVLNIIVRDKRSKEHFENKILEMNTNYSEFLFQCTGGEQNIYIDTFGYINMCVVLLNKKFNIKDSTIASSINYFKKFKEQKYLNSNCQFCNKKSICRYCPARFYLETSSFNNCSPWYCNMADKIIQYYDTFLCKDISFVIDNMFEIISTNMNSINLGIKVTLTDFEIWKNNVLNNNNLQTIISKGSELYGYLQFIKNKEEIFICEIQINEKYQHNGKTFKKLLNALINYCGINCDTKIILNISPNNIHSKDVFCHIGFKKEENNKYSIAGKELIKYLN